MNTARKLRLFLSAMLLGTLAFVGGAAPADGATVSPLTPTVELGSGLVHSERPNTVYLKVNLRGNPPETAQKRTPVNIALVIDKSGSMQGDKIEKAKEAAVMAIGRLTAEDIVSVVTYDNDVSVIVPATRATDKDYIYAQIQKISAGGSTALFAGVSKGAAEVRKFVAEERANRIVLLSDGLANVGPSNPSDLAELGDSLGRERISVSTIGLGLDYNEDLMARLAESGGGNHLFAENAADLARAYDMEFGDLLSVVAQNVQIQVDCGELSRIVRVLGHQGVVAGQRASVTMPQIYANQDRYIVVELELQPIAAAQRVVVAEVGVHSADNPRIAYRFQPQVETSTSEAAVQASANPRVMASVARQIGAERMLQAQRLRDAGEVEAAKAAFLSNRAMLLEQGQLYNDRHLLRDAATNELIAEQVEDDRTWQLNRKVGVQEAQKAIKQGLGFKN